MTSRDNISCIKIKNIPHTDTKSVLDKSLTQHPRNKIAPIGKV